MIISRMRPRTGARDVPRCAALRRVQQAQSASSSNPRRHRQIRHVRPGHRCLWRCRRQDSYVLLTGLPTLNWRVSARSICWPAISIRPPNFPKHILPNSSPPTASRIGSSNQHLFDRHRQLPEGRPIARSARAQARPSLSHRGARKVLGAGARTSPRAASRRSS